MWMRSMTTGPLTNVVGFDNERGCGKLGHGVVVPWLEKTAAKINSNKKEQSILAILKQ
jgi:hypothetical protein